MCGQAGTGKTFFLTNIARRPKLIELQKNVAFTYTSVTISKVCFVVDSNYFLKTITFQRL